MTAPSFLNNTVSDLTTIVHDPHRLFCILNTDVSRSELGIPVYILTLLNILQLALFLGLQ